MKMLARFAFAAIAGSSSMPSIAQSGDSFCPSTIAVDLCDILKIKNDHELVSFFVAFTRNGVVIPHTDPKKDTAPPPSSGPGGFPEHEAYTQQLFSKYDLRWPESTEVRASLPSPKNGMYEGSYRLFATKATILALSTESYVQEVARWSPDGPVGTDGSLGINGPAKNRFNAPASRYLFNARGQKLRASDQKTPLFQVRKNLW